MLPFGVPYLGLAKQPPQHFFWEPPFWCCVLGGQLISKLPTASCRHLTGLLRVCKCRLRGPSTPNGSCHKMGAYMCIYICIHIYIYATPPKTYVLQKNNGLRVRKPLPSSLSWEIYTFHYDLPFMRLQCLPGRVARHWLGNVHSQITHTHIHKYILTVPIEYLLKFIMPFLYPIHTL